jgi:hypothetical protein
MLILVLLLHVACSGAALVAYRPVVAVAARHCNWQRPRPLRMQELGSTREEGAASDPPGLPPFLASRISFQTGGFKQPNQEEETLILWNTFKQCYATEADAEAAVNKNSMTVNPSMNSPSKISGTFALLKERFGLDEARRIIMANPGILTCTRQAVEKQTDDDILKATEFVTLVDKNKGLVKILVGSSFFAFFPLVGWRIGNVRGWW